MEDIGFVGDVTNVNADILYDLLEKDFLPIICPVGLDDDNNTYNINADDAACAIAKAMKAEKLAFLTDIEGVYKDPQDSSTLISSIQNMNPGYPTLNSLDTEGKKYLDFAAGIAVCGLGYSNELITSGTFFVSIFSGSF